MRGWIPRRSRSPLTRARRFEASVWPCEALRTSGWLSSALGVAVKELLSTAELELDSCATVAAGTSPAFAGLVDRHLLGLVSIIIANVVV
jgi:hypothetical protein